MNNKLSDKELKILLDNLVIVSDTRDQKWEHIEEYFKKKKIKYVRKKLNAGDYSCYIESNEDTRDIIGNRNMWFDDDIAIERKAHIDELAASIKDRTRFTNEFDRAMAKGTQMLLFVEDPDGLSNIINKNYRSEYQPKALYASIKTFEGRYGFTTHYVSKNLIGMEIYHSLKYKVRDILK